MKRLYTKPTIRTCRVEDSEPLLAASETQTTSSTVSFDNLDDDDQPHTTDYDNNGGDGSGNYNF